MKTTYEIQASRADRAIYYAYEYSLRTSVAMLASEPKFGMHRVQTIGGTSKKTLGVFTKRRDAVRYCSRIREVTAAMRGRLTGNVCGGGSAEIVRN